MFRNLLIFSFVLALFLNPKIGVSQNYKVVITTDDFYAPGEFRYELETAVAGDTIMIDVAGTVLLTNPIILNGAVTVIGPQPIHFVVDASGITGASPIIQTNGVDSYFNGITFINAPAPYSWFGLSVSENLSLQRCVFKNNNDSPIRVEAGSLSQVKLESCSFMSNMSTYSGGAVYMDDGNLEVINSTFYQNQATVGGSGGAIFFGSNGTCNLISSTFYNNGTVPVVPGGAVDNYFSNGFVMSQNSLYYNIPQSDTILAGLGYTNNGGNFINASNPPIGFFNNVVGIGQDPLLSTLIIDGFGMEYFSLQGGSPCIDIGNPTGLTKYDQRRVWRDMEASFASPYADAGAIEFSPYTVRNVNGSGGGSFNKAVNDLTLLGYAGNKAIVFEVGGALPFIINQTVASTITQTRVIVNGFSQNGSIIPGPMDNIGNITPAFTPNEFIGDGTSDFLYIGTVADSVVVAGLSVSNYAKGIVIDAMGVQIEGCHIGVDAYGTAVNGNTTGISLPATSPGGGLIGVNSYIGNHPNNSRNVITGNTLRQVEIIDNGDNVITGNFIGAFSDGITAPTFASTEGISIFSTGSAFPPNTIGGYGEYEDNLIVGQNLGIYNEMADVTIINNLFGSDYTGFQSGFAADFKNNTAIQLTSANAYGGYIEGNLIGNCVYGISIDNGANFNYVTENLIGLSGDGVTPLSLTGSGLGITMFNASNNVIGGLDSLDGNFIANCNVGVSIITSTSQISNDSIVGNFIGLDTTFAPAPNNTGISINSNIQDVFIGDTVPGYGNQIAYNINEGVSISNTGVSGVRMSGNGMFNNGTLNGALGIDIDQDGPSLTVGTAPISNQSQIPPNILAIANCGTNNYTTVKFEVDFPTGFVYQIEFFETDSDNQEGAIYLGAMTVNPVVQPDTFYMDLPSPASISGGYLVATATKFTGPSTFHTSEFSASKIITTSSVTAVDASMTYCSDIPGGGTATIDLVVDLNSVVNGGTGDQVTWFTDANLTIPIASPTAFVCSTQVIYAGVTNGICLDTAMVTITVNPSPDVTTFNKTWTDETCLGSCDGTINYGGPTGGGETYDFGDGSGPQISNFTSGLCAGTYTLTFVDANGCIGTDTYTINSPPAISVAPPTGTDPLCNGSFDGTISIAIPAGGTPGYTYSFDGGVSYQASGTYTGLPAGTYFTEVMDANGCVQTAGSITLFDPIALTAVIGSVTDITCFGFNDGSATVIVSNGTPIYTYQWYDNGTGFPIAGETNVSISTLPAGNFYCEVTDANSCLASSNLANINEPAAITVFDIVDNQVTCFGANDGQATVTGSGGTIATDYTYNWIPAPGFGQGTNVGGGLPPGSYNVDVIDDNGCMATSTPIVITEPSLLTVSYTQIDPTCNGFCDGQATANPSGGTLGYTYAWSSGGTSATDINLCAGVQNVTVTDLNGCTVTGGVTLIDPLVVIAFAGPDTTICEGSSVLMTGSANGGLAPYTFTWDNGVTDGTSITPIVTTTYSVIATDFNGCTSSPDPMIITIDAAPTSNAGLDVSVCANNPDVTLSGSATSFASINWLGGAGTYNPNNFTLNTIYTPTPAEIATGSLTLTLIADGLGACTTPVSDVVLITFTPAPTVNAGIDQTVCGNNVSVTFSSSTSAGGVIWTSTGGGAFTLNNTDPNPTYVTTPAAIAAGVDSLFLTTTGNGNCNAVTDTLLVTINPAPTVNAGGDTTICSGGVANLNGSFTLASSVSWITSGDGSFSSTTAPISSYSPGFSDNAGSTVSLYLSTTGPTGCNSEIDSTVVTVLAPLTTSAITGPSTVCENATGVAYSVSSTTGSTYAWTLPPGASIVSGVGTNSILVDFGNTSGSVDVIETNSIGCIGTTVTLPITVDPVPITSAITGPTIICANSTGVIYNVTLTAGSTYLWSLPAGVVITAGAGTNTITADFGTTGGNITVTETSATGCIGSPVVLTTTVNSAPNIIVTFTDVTCSGLTDGTITTTVTGGSAPFQFSIDGGVTYTAGTSPFVSSSLLSANYNVEVVDGGGCLSNQVPVFINEPAPLAFDSIQVIDESCVGNDGSIIVFGANGGSPNYNYSIDGGGSFQIDSSFTNQIAGTYNIVLQDQNGCSLNLGSTIINGAIPIIISTDFFTDVTCNGLADGSITSFSATGGSGGFTYQWYNTITGLIGGQVILTATNLPSGDFYIEATDLSGCTQNSDTVLISEPAPIVLNVVSTDPICSNTNDGTISIDITSGGVAPYSFSTDGGVTTVAGNQPFVFSNLIGNSTYTPSVTDANGCSVNGVDVNLTNPAPVVTTVVVTDISCFGSADGQFEVTMSGGASNYTLSTDGGGTFTVPTANPEIINAAVGSFVINVVTMDANGCTSDTAQYTVVEPAQITSTVTTIPDTCSQGIGQIIVSNVTGGAGAPYGYTIDGGTTVQASNIFNVVPGSYNVVVGDVNNCIDANLSIVVADISGTLTLAGAYPGDTICPGESVFVQAYGGTSYNWLTIGVLDPLSDSSEVTPDVSTLYVVEISSGNCMKVDSTEIIVSAEGCALGEVSNNVFSPDGDGVNESFVLDIQYLLTNDNTVKIYNRWGDLINEFNNYNNVDVFWNGTNRDGRPVTAGTYFYVVEIPSVNYSNSGWIQVVR